jgi:hypothetical protein
MTPAVIFGALNMATSVAAYFGLIDSVSSNVKKLLHAPFNSAISNLKAALHATDENVEFYIRQALVEFNNACSLEENENLISAYLGKALCQHLLKDYYNRDLSMANIKKVELSLSEKTKAALKDPTISVGGVFGYLLAASYYSLAGRVPPYEARKISFERYKQLALKTT